ncbi:heme peroxidase [Mycena epipterygia]|nr:heme peroxidase [Mycena epipterygia]
MLGLIFPALLVTVDAYIWPLPQLDALEVARFNQLGHNEGFASFIDPCNIDFFPANDSGRSDTADWIRTAYHDMATHNVMDGTGGLDASIHFADEQARPEACRANAGDGFANTLNVLIYLADRYISIADALAIGVLFAIENCGGPEIAFRGGRVHAGEPNMPGVPQPQQDLQSHIESFARQGFTQTEIISLVACGHTFGGVQHAAFPDIVPEFNDTTDTLSVAHFDSAFATFNNNVATEYISGTTQNPLVVGFNDTTNSNKRLFSSDGNATMASFANSPELFSSTCADLFARMLDTVPRGVQLTEVIKPLPVKPSGLELILDGDTLQFSGEVRLWNMTLDDTHIVNLLWDDYVDGTNNVSLPLRACLPPPGASIARHGITSMHFVVDGKLEDQGDIGFAVQDGVLFSTSSCLTSKLFTSPFVGRFDVAVRNGLNPGRVYLEQTTQDDVGRPIVLETEIPRPAHPLPTNAGYFIWINLNNTGIIAWTVGAEVDGVKLVLNDGLHPLAGYPSCST